MPNYRNYCITKTNNVTVSDLHRALCKAEPDLCKASEHFILYWPAVIYSDAAGEGSIDEQRATKNSVSVALGCSSSHCVPEVLP